MKPTQQQDTGSADPILSPRDRLFQLLGDENEEGGEDETQEQDPGEGVDPNDPELTLEEEDEDLGEGEEGDPDEEDEAEGPAADLHTVKVDGEELQVPYDELLKGYSRTAHFTRQMQALRTRETEFAEEAQAVSQERKQYAVLLNQLHQYLTSQGTRNPEEWETLKRTDPIGFALAREEERERQEKIAATQEELRVAQERMERDQRAQLAEVTRAETQKLMDAVPEWKDPSRKAKDFENILGYATSLGYGPQELAQVYDHRLVLILRDAASYNALRDKQRGLKPVQDGPRPMPGGKPQTPQPRGRKKALQRRERLRETGTVRDAAAAIATIIE